MDFYCLISKLKKIIKFIISKGTPNFWVKVVLWSNLCTLIFRCDTEFHERMKMLFTVCKYLPTLVSEIFKSDNCVKYADEMTDDVMLSTQFYIEYVNRTILANLQHKSLKFGRLTALQETHMAMKILLSWQLTLSSPHLLDFNTLWNMFLKNVQQGCKLKLTQLILYACWVMHMRHY